MTQSNENRTGGSNRYKRQLPLFGEGGQQKLREASVFVAGTGGLGSPVSVYLAAAGVGKIVLLDDDVVEETNLNRQFLHFDTDIGRKKAESGADKLCRMNPEISVEAVCCRLTAENAEELVGDCQIIVDALDNDQTRRVLAAVAARTNRPYFHAAVSGFGGQIASFYPDVGPCYFCAFPEAEDENSTEKVLFPIVGATAGIIGSMEAGEVIKYIVGEKKQTGKLFIWDGRQNSFMAMDLERDEGCPVCCKTEKKV